MIVPSTGIVSPGRIRRISPCRISSADIISSFSSFSLRPFVGARRISFFKPFFARFVVASSKSAPIAMINTTSPAANRSPIAIAANMAIQIKRADDILLMPGLWIIRHIARYKRGIPLIMIVTHAGSKGRNESCTVVPPNSSVKCGIKSSSRNAPATIVMGSPARKHSNFFNIMVPPIRTASLTVSSLTPVCSCRTINLITNTLFFFYCR